MEKKYTVAKITMVTLLLILSICFYIIPPVYSTVIFILFAFCAGGVGYLYKTSDLIKIAIVSYLTATLSFYIKTPDITAFYFAFRDFLFLYPTAALTGYLLKKKYDFKTLYTYSVLSFVLCIMLYMLKLSAIDGINIMDKYIRQPVKFMMDTNIMLHDLPISADATIFTPEYVELIVESIAYSVPSVIIIASMFLVFTYIFVLKRIIKLINKDEKFENMVSFSNLKLKRTTVVTLFALYLVSIFSSGMFGIVIGNIISVLIIMCTACGLSLIDFYFKKAIRYSIIRITTYILLFAVISLVFALYTFMNPFMLLALIGMIDASRDFRKIDKSNIRIIFK